MLFDNSFIDLFVQDNSYYDDNKLFDCKEGLEKGNMFKEEYLPYKNYKPSKLVVRNEKEKLLLKLYESDFALHDLGLYLDLHPNDVYMYEEFKKELNTFNETKSVYENKYGPLCLEDSNGTDYDWYLGPWPFDKGGINNV